MIITDAMKVAKEGLVAVNTAGLSFTYIPSTKKYRFTRDYTQEDLIKQWSMRWPTKKESLLWVKN